MSYESFIANKHMTHRRKTGFVSLISVISIMGVSVGVMALIVVLAVMSGFDRELKAKIVNVQPHLRIEKAGGIDNPEADIKIISAGGAAKMRNIAGFVEGQAILRSDENATGVIVKGLDVQHDDMSIYAQHVIEGSLDFEESVAQKIQRQYVFFKNTVETRTGGIVIGDALAARLGVRVGDVVSLISPFQDSTMPLSLARAETRPFEVRGIFRIGMNDFDTALALVDLRQAQAIYHLGNRISGISVRFLNVDDAEKWKYQLRGEFSGDYVIRSWYDMNHNFFQALKVEKSVMTILLALIVLVAVFNIVSTLIMVVMEKTKDIGILRAIGATRWSIRKIFLMEGFSIGFLGIVVGTISGLVMAYNLNPISDFLKANFGLEVFPSDIYYFDRIPAEVHPEDVMMTVGFALIASILAGFYPAHRAAQLDPVEALRYE